MKKNRSTLKDYFKKGAIPTEANFADLIDSMLTQDEDNISKLPNDPLKITATGVDEALLNFYRIENTVEKIAWQIKQKPDGKAGLSIGDNAVSPAASRLFIESGTGNVGIGTTTPTGRLNISEAIGTLNQPANGTLVLDHENSGGASSIVFRSKVNRGSDYGYIQYQDTATVGGTGEKAVLTIGIQNDADDHIALMPSGNVGIGTSTPTAKLHVSGGQILLDGAQKLVFSDNDTSNNLKLQLWSGYGLGINGGTLFYAANGNHSWRDNGGVNERMLLTTGADGGLTVKGTGVSSFAGAVTFGSVQLKGYTGADAEEWPNVFWYRDTANNWDEGLIKGSSARGKFGRSGFGIHMHQSRQFSLFSTGWDSLLAVEGGTGNTFVKGNLGVGTSTVYNPQGWNKVLEVMGTSHARLNVRSSGGVVTSVFSHDDWGGARGVIGTDSNHPISFATNYIHRMAIDLNGNVGIGTNTPAGRLNISEPTGTVSGINGGTLTLDHENNGGVSSIVFRSKVNRTSDHAYIQYQDAATVGGAGEAAVLTIGIQNDADDHIALMPAGNVGIGTSAPITKLDVAGTIRTQKLRLGDKWVLSGVGDYHGNDEWLRLHGLRESGQSTANYWPGMATSGEYSGFAVGKLWAVNNSVQGSDMRMKEEIDTLDHPIEDLLSLRGVQFKWRKDGTSGKQQIGLIAQEVELFFPELVEIGPEGIKGINYNGLIAPLIEAIKQQQMQIGSLRTEIQALKNI